MIRTKKTWAYNSKKARPKVPEKIKNKLNELSAEFIEKELKPRYISPRRKHETFNYIIDIFTKWHQNYFYFCAKYCSPDKNSLSATFNTKFARLEYLPSGKYNLCYMRHTGQWWETEKRITQNESFKQIKEGGLYLP